MAATYAVTNFTRDITAKRIHRGTLTATGTYTGPGGDTVTAALFGLAVITDLRLEPFASATPLVFQARYSKTNDTSGVIKLFGTNAAPGAAVADPEVTGGTAVTGFTCAFEAIGF